MVYSGILCTEADIAHAVGENPNVTGDDEASHNLLVAQAESYLGLIGNYDFVANVATLTAMGKQTLAEYCARFAAVGILAYDATAIVTATSLIEYEDRIQIHLYRMQLIEKLISDQNYVKIIAGVV